MPRFVGVIPGAHSVAEVDGYITYLETPIPPQVWHALKAENLVDAAAPSSEGAT